MLELYAGWSQSQQDETGFIACLPRDQPNGRPLHGHLFTRYGRVVVTPAPEQPYYYCHITIWSGCMYRLAAVRRIGFPNPNYFIDRDDLEFAYRLMKAGYKGFIHQHAVIRHNIRGAPSLVEKRLKLGPITLRFYELPALRCYYTCRNTLYFALYDSVEGRFTALRGDLWRIRPLPGRPGWMNGVAWQAALLTLNFILRPRHHRAQMLACLRGIWHGVTGNIAARY
jgi:hypothetical protein